MSLRSRVAAPLAAMSLALGLAAASLSAPTSVLGSNGYTETATTTYAVNPTARRLDVAIDITFKNTQRSTATFQYYFSGVYVWLEQAGVHVAATVGGTPQTVRHVKAEAGFDQYEVRFSSAAFYGQTRQVHVTYQLPSGAPRSSSDIRVDKAIASFCVVAQGDDGGTTTVVIPSGYTVTVPTGSGGTLSQVTTGASTVTRTWTTGSLAQPYAFWACLSGTNEAGYTTTRAVSPGGREIDLQAWPEDTTWQSEVTGELNGILTKLETLVGRPLPGTGPIVLREVAGSELGNYAGFYNSVTGVIVLGEDLGQSAVLAHELSHAWFNDKSFFATWMSEGMAEWARVSTVADSCSAPTKYPGPGSPDLADWQFAGPRATATDLGVVDYQYAAACYIVTTLEAKAGPGRWRDVLNAFFEDQLAYQAPGTVLTHPRIQVTWQQWLDAVDELGLVPAGVADLDYAQNLLRQYGIATDSAALAARSKARARYHKLVDELGDWTMPEAVLRPMAAWSFTAAGSAMDEVEAILASVAKADTTLPSIDAAGGPVRHLFEQAKTVDDLKAAAALAADQATAAAAVGAASDRVAMPRDAIAGIGLAGADLDGPMTAALAAAKAGDLKSAQADVAQVNALLDGAAQQGILRLALAIIVALALLLLVAFVLIRTRGSRRRRAIPLGAPLDAPPDVPPEVPPEVPPGIDP